MLGIARYFSKSWEFIIDTNNDFNALFIATGLAVILGTYITEPFFSKPIDVITKWLAIILFLVGLNSKNCLSLYPYWIGFGIFFIVIAITMIFVQSISKIEKTQRIIVDLICKISRPEIVFTLLYIDIVVSLFRYNQTEYPVLIGFGFLLAINKPIVYTINYISKIFNTIKSKNIAGEFLGTAIGHNNEDIYNVEIQISNDFRQDSLRGKLVYIETQSNGVVGIILRERILLGKKWIEILTLRDSNMNLISFNLKNFLPLTDSKSIFSKTNAVFLLNKNALSIEAQELINENPITADFKNFIGYVWENSSIQKIRFNQLFTQDLFLEKNIGEGTILQTVIGNQEVLYQIIDGRTEEEKLEYKDKHGFTIGTAQKLGNYNSEEQELNTVKWLPQIYSPIFLLKNEELDYNAKDFIGKLPNTNFGIPIKSVSELVTHNTAILGILGIGKSRLTFELIQKVVLNSDSKILCIDITGQYMKEMANYIKSGIEEIDYENINLSIELNYKAINKDVEEGGNYKIFKQKITDSIQELLNVQDKRVLIFNPQNFIVSYQVGEVKNKKVGPGSNDWQEVASMRDLTISEITRLISEVSLELCRENGITDNPKLLIVFEEAHSLVPEWSSAANEGDKAATYGTAKVILQGRKYGLGSFVITQRTANISKSILNQCNTIFAMRIFDDTGKQFLENYIGSDYSNLLPTLEERHCIAIGKSLKLKQPVILQLNDMKDIQIE